MQKVKILTKQDYTLNNYRAKKIKKDYLVTTDHGSFVLLNERNYRLLESNRLERNSKLFTILEEKGILLTKDNIKKIIKDFRKKYSFLYQGTSLHIVVPTLRCNQKCVYCHAASKPINAKGFDMDKEIAKKTVDFIFQSPSQNITIEFQGGEPLLNFEIMKFIIEYAKELNKKHKKNLLMTAVTNLNVMNKEKLDYFLKNNVTLCTSLDGPKVIHEKNRNKNTFSNVEKWIKKLSNIKNYRVNALLTVTKHCLGYPKEIVDTYVSFGLKVIHLRFLDNLGYANNVWGDIGYNTDEFLKFWRKALEYIIELNNKGIEIRERSARIILQKILDEKDPNYLDLRSPCGAAIGQLAYMYNGDVYTCDEGRMVKDTDMFRIGNVKKNSYKEVLTSKQTCAIVAASTNDTQFCDSCVYKPYCGLCPVCNYAEQGNLIARLPETNRCKIFKAQFSYIFEKLLYDKKAKRIFLSWSEKGRI